MSFHIQMLGTGGAFAKNYFNNNALVFDEDFTLLLDCGVTAPLSMHHLGRSLGSVDALLVTHTHADHVGGMEELAFRMKDEFKRKLPLYIAEPLVRPLWENTLSGGLFRPGSIESLNDIFDVRPVTPGTPFQISKNLKAELIQTTHVPNKDTYSIYFNDSVFYSGDMVFHPELLKQLVYERGCEIIFHECQLEGHGAVHTTLSELRSLPEDIQQRIYLMHYGDNMSEYREQTGSMTFLEQHKLYEL